MKKRLTVILIFLILVYFSVASVFGSVTVKLFRISETDVAGTITLVVSCRTQSTYAYKITKFRGSFSMGNNLENIYNSAVFSNHFFDGTKYSRTFGTTDDDELWFNYEVTSVTKGDTATLDDMATTPWQTMFDATITYPHTPNETTTFSWSQDTLPTNMMVIVYFRFPGGPPIPVETNVNTGGQLIDPDLIDQSLPIEMCEIIGDYDLNGITINWETASEINNLGFEIYRFKEIVNMSGKLGEYEKISDLIEGTGNSSVGRQYTFVDPNVETNKIYTYRINQLSTSGSVEDTYYIMVSTKVPENFKLNQNYPNPFNPDTKIVYALPEQSHVQLKVYNILGKEIRTLIDETQSANNHTVIWDGRNASGVNVPSGIYFYKLEAGNHVHVKKMMKLQ